MSQVLSTDTRVGPAPDQISCDLNGEAVILNLKSGVYYGLDEVGARVWKLIEEPRTLHEIRDELVQEYDVSPEQCEADVRGLLARMLDEGLIEVRDGTPA